MLAVSAEPHTVRETTVARAANCGEDESAELCDSLTGELIAFHSATVHPGESPTVFLAACVIRGIKERGRVDAALE